jgi:hypothetical protein
MDNTILMMRFFRLLSKRLSHLPFGNQRRTAITLNMDNQNLRRSRRLSGLQVFKESFEPNAKLRNLSYTEALVAPQTPPTQSDRAILTL